MTIAPTLAALLAQLPPDQALEFGRLQEALYQVRFTGPVTIDFLNGMPRQINLGQPVKLAICQGGSVGRNGHGPASGLDKVASSSSG